eukprot:160928-Pyramimonas_sp.AAC.1
MPSRAGDGRCLETDVVRHGATPLRGPFLALLDGSGAAGSLCSQSVSVSSLGTGSPPLPEASPSRAGRRG